MRKQGWMSTGLMIAFITLVLAVVMTPWQAARGQLVQLQGKVTDFNAAERNVTVLDSQTSEPMVLQLGRDAFEPGQGWKNLHKKPRVTVMATYNFDGSVQARRLVML